MISVTPAGGRPLSRDLGAAHSTWRARESGGDQRSCDIYSPLFLSRKGTYIGNTGGGIGLGSVASAWVRILIQKVSIGMGETLQKINHDMAPDLVGLVVVAATATPIPISTNMHISVLYAKSGFNMSTDTCAESKFRYGRNPTQN